MDKTSKRIFVSLRNIIVDDLKRSNVRLHEMTKNLRKEVQKEHVLLHNILDHNPNFHRTRKTTETHRLTKSSRTRKTVKRLTCSIVGCNKFSQGRLRLCYSHGGGYRCLVPGCSRAARDASRRCISHGGGPRCSYEGCKAASRGRSGLCTRHERALVSKCIEKVERETQLC
eukprot:snap_masked-scaffold_1-processed-gene-27.22-mRNA-1 protein AED:0.18 eAED:0.18 QI:0/-1/0/1/-1/1/1/0/170